MLSTPRSENQQRASQERTEKEWLILLLRSEAEWMRRNDENQETHARLLTISHGLLILAVILFSLGVAVVHAPI